MSYRLTLLASLILACLPAAAIERGIMLREAVIYVNPSTDSAKLSNIGRGREVAVMQRTPGWANVVGTVGASYTPEDPENESDRNVTGWVEDKGVITTLTPDGDRILFGEAFDSEMEASKRGGRRGAAQDAMRLYARIAEYFPQSPLAAESAYRAADIRWQLEAADAATRPSAKERDPALHYQIDEERMKQVIKKYPHTKWADLAAYHLIDNKLCGDWEGSTQCPEKEADLYLKYAVEYPDGPRTARALYEAVYRFAVLNDMFAANGDDRKSNDAQNQARSAAAQLKAHFADSDYAMRAAALVYKLNEGIPVYGIERE